MAANYPFIAFCSAILNTKTNRKAFQNPSKQKELFTKYNLTRAQIKAAKDMDIDALKAEFEKELKKAVKEASGPKNAAFFW